MSTNQSWLETRKRKTKALKKKICLLKNADDADDDDDLDEMKTRAMASLYTYQFTMTVPYGPIMPKPSD